MKDVPDESIPAQPQSAAAGAWPEPEKASVEDWIAVFAGALGALLASLDISITNAALPTIQGEIGASGTEGTWISTGYLVSEVVMIPLSAWLSRVLGLRTLLLVCVVLFTLFSMMCGTSQDMMTMIIGRVGQGFFGGALIPTAQTITRTRLPQHQIPIGMSMFGLIVLLGPLIGPLVGGWLTENASWQWCFFLNLPISIGLVALLLLGLPHTKSNLLEVIHADWLGIVGLALGLSSLTVVLEEGQRQQWFNSKLIVDLSLTCVFGLILLGISQFTARRPVIKLALLGNWAYASVIILVTVVGMSLYAVIYVLPQFLSIIGGENAEQSGRVLFISGIPAFLVMPILPRLLGRVNIKILVGCGFGAFVLSCFINTHLTDQYRGAEFLIPQLLRGAGQMLAFMPLNQASVGAVSREDTADASGLYNMARNLGGSLGLAAIGVFIDRRTESHADAIRETLNANSPMVQDHIASQAAGFAVNNGGDLAYGHTQALQALAGTIHSQALVMTYSDCFFVLGFCIIALSPLILLLRAPPPLGGRPAPAAEH
ncbi:MAG: DHA2 family efflux MFS transporter permease subunit [Caulobacteraceae bacterium]|nr:DHA2 family efflux MFS transporter permease subunit [Caulobacteraceae bacterium]